ncbi:MAG: hypothetical protein GF310_11920 [candidate division Zixibacteria bacterium]|nr:hypothetical protein [candidate division Zixibacteria bacterium]
MEEKRKNVRRIPNDYFLVYDRHHGNFIGRLLNMSLGGMMLVSEGPIETSKIFYCRMDLPEKVQGRNNITFDAVSKWCRMNDNTKMYETGYELKDVSKETREIIGILMKKWIAVQNATLNSWSTPLR